jgi:F-type H+-transporting ATPase subunit a
MRLSPDQMIFWQHGFFKLNGTIVFTWGLMLVLAVGSKLITRKLSTDLKRSRWQNLLEIVVTGIEKQIEEVGLSHPEEISRLSGHALPVRRAGQPLHVIPGYEPPTVRSRPRRRSRCACLWPCRSSASRSRAGRLPQVLREADVHHAAV